MIKEIYHGKMFPSSNIPNHPNPEYEKDFHLNLRRHLLRNNWKYIISFQICSAMMLRFTVKLPMNLDLKMEQSS